MRNRMYGGVRGRKTKVGEKLLRFPPTRLFFVEISSMLVVSSSTKLMDVTFSYSKDMLTPLISMFFAENEMIGFSVSFTYVVLEPSPSSVYVKAKR